MHKEHFVIREYKQEDAPLIKRCIIELQDFEHGLEPDCVEGVILMKELASHLEE